TSDGYRSFVNHLLLRYERLPEALPVHPGGRSGGVRALERPTLPARAEWSELLARGESVSLTDVLQQAADFSGCLALYWSAGLHGAILHRGLTQLLTQPEFLTTDNALPLVQLLEDEGELANVLRDIQSEGGLHIRIGTENRDSQLYAFSMLAMRLEKDPGRGVLALLGPTRMSYRKGIIAILTAWEELTALFNPDRRGRLEY
ncbi:MAG: hypothetical protein LBP28_06690, partial [Coriobacteriales bacterium]|nr:hypothetical protein [Coriobacteriales bacterium]